MKRFPQDRLAKPGTIWVCGACGKTAEDQYGIEGRHSYGWDESCMMHSVLCHEEKAENGNWVAVEQEEEEG